MLWGLVEGSVPAVVRQVWPQDKHGLIPATGFTCQANRCTKQL